MLRSTELQATPNRKLHILGGQAGSLFTMFSVVLYLIWQASGKGEQQQLMAKNDPHEKNSPWHVVQTWRDVQASGPLSDLGVLVLPQLLAVVLYTALKWCPCAPRQTYGCPQTCILPSPR